MYILQPAFDAASVTKWSLHRLPIVLFLRILLNSKNFRDFVIIFWCCATEIPRLSIIFKDFYFISWRVEISLASIVSVWKRVICGNREKGGGRRERKGGFFDGGGMTGGEKKYKIRQKRKEICLKIFSSLLYKGSDVPSKHRKSKHLANPVPCLEF